MPDLRVFIAIELPLPVQNLINNVISQLKTQNLRAVRWVAAQNIHLTLKFIGDISPLKISAIDRLLSEVTQQYKPFEMDLSHIGAFPNLRHPRVIWLGISAPPVLLEMQQAIETGCHGINLKGDDKPFTPHLTIGRILRDSSLQDIREVESVISRQKINTLATMLVKSVCLYKSDLHSTGPVYTRLSIFSL